MKNEVLAHMQFARGSDFAGQNLRITYLGVTRMRSILCYLGFLTLANLPTVLCPFSAMAMDLPDASVKQASKMPYRLLEATYLDNLCGSDCVEPVTSKQDLLNLSLAQKIVLSLYSQGEYIPINDALWADGSKRGAKRLTPSQAAFVRILDQALSRIPSQQVTVYRGTNKRLHLALGKTVLLKGYTSTSTDKRAAGQFTAGRMMVIKVKSGKSIRDYSYASEESEILLPRRIRLRVDKITIHPAKLEVPGSIPFEIVELSEL